MKQYHPPLSPKLALLDHAAGEQCPRALGLFAFDPAARRLYRVRCGCRRCEVCGKFWSQRWRARLEQQQDIDILRATLDNKVYKKPLALTLTTAYNVDYQKVRRAMLIFWRLMRRRLPQIEYWGVTEYNQKHTQPHFHFLLIGYEFIDYKFVRSCWMEAQKQADFQMRAFVVRVEKINYGVQHYFTKYLTKQSGGKDEIPRRYNWKGRYVRYSRAFFSSAAAVQLAALALKSTLATGQAARPRFANYNTKDFWQTLFHVKQEQQALGGLVNRVWHYRIDRSRSAPPDLLTFCSGPPYGHD